MLQAHSPRRPEIRQGHGSQAQFSKRRCAFPPDTGSPRDCQGHPCSPPGTKAAGHSSLQSGRDELTSVAIKCIPEKLRSHQGPFYEYGLPFPDQLCGKQPLSLKGQRRNRMAIRKRRGQSFKGSSLHVLPSWQRPLLQEGQSWSVVSPLHNHVLRKCNSALHSAAHLPARPGHRAWDGKRATTSTVLDYTEECF